MSASATASVLVFAGRAHAVQLPFGPLVARPQARTAPPYSRPSGSTVLNLVVCVLVAPAPTLSRPSDEPSGQLAPSSQVRSSQTSSPARPLPSAPHAIPSLSTWSEMRRPLRVAAGTGSVSPAAPPVDLSQ